MNAATKLAPVVRLRVGAAPDVLEVVTPCAACGVRMPLGTPVLAGPRGTTHATGECPRFWSSNPRARREVRRCR